MNSNGVLYLTVNHNGHLRMWDSTSVALGNKAPDEVVVQLSLTQPQMTTLIKAGLVALNKHRELNKRGPHSGASASGDGY